MNLKKLISCVYERKSIWDQKHEGYNNKVVVKQMWVEIAQEMNYSAEVCRQKWRSLRDVFRRELRKYQARLENPNISDKAKPRWYYFDELQFLMDQMLGFDNVISDFISEEPQEEPFESYYVKNNAIESYSIKKEPDSIGQEEQLVLLENSNDAHFFAEIDEDSRGEELDDGTGVANVHEKRRLKRPVSSQSFMPLRDGRKRARIERGGEDDSDYHFLMSLLPFLQAIPHERKILVRTKIQNVFCEEINSK